MEDEQTQNLQFTTHLYYQSLIPQDFSAPFRTEDPSSYLLYLSISSARTRKYNPDSDAVKRLQANRIYNNNIIIYFIVRYKHLALSGNSSGLAGFI